MPEKQTFDSNQKEERTIPGMYKATLAARENADTWEGRDTTCEGRYITQNALSNLRVTETELS